MNTKVIEEHHVAGFEIGTPEDTCRKGLPNDVVRHVPVVQRPLCAGWKYPIDACRHDVEAGSVTPAFAEAQPSIDRPDAVANEGAVLMPRRTGLCWFSAPQGAF